MKMKIAEKEKNLSLLYDPSIDPNGIPAMPGQDHGVNDEDLEDMIMFLTGNGPPGPYDDIIDGSLDLSLDGQWSQL